MRVVYLTLAGLGGSVQCAPGDQEVAGLVHELFSSAILSLPLIQERQLSVSLERMCKSTRGLSLYMKIVQSTIVISKSTGHSEILRDIRICGIEEKRLIKQQHFTNEYVNGLLKIDIY